MVLGGTADSCLYFFSTEELIPLPVDPIKTFWNLKFDIGQPSSKLDQAGAGLKTKGYTLVHGCFQILDELELRFNVTVTENSLL